MALAAKLYRLDSQPSGRQADRLSVEVDATVRAASAQPLDASVSDLSETGFCARLDQDLPIGSEISIGLPGVGVLEACVVRTVGDSYGCRFLVPLTPAALERAPSTQTIVAFPAPASPWSPVPAATGAVARDPDKLSGWMSLSIIVGSSALLWAGIIAGVRVAVA